MEKKDSDIHIFLSGSLCNLLAFLCVIFNWIQTMLKPNRFDITFALLSFLYDPIFTTR